MSSRDDDRRRGMDDGWLRGRFEILLSAQAEFNQQMGYDGQVSGDVHAEFEAQVVHMYNALEHHQDHEKAGKKWDEFDMDQIPHVCNQTRLVKNEQVGDFGFKKTSSETLVKRAPPEYLNHWTLGFKRMMNDLGLLTSVKQGIESTDVTHDDLAALLESRGQAEALDNSNVN